MTLFRVWGLRMLCSNSFSKILSFSARVGYHRVIPVIIHAIYRNDMVAKVQTPLASSSEGLPGFPEPSDKL